MHVPELVVAGRLGDAFAAQAWRAERQQLREEGDDGRLLVALIADGTGDRGLGDVIRAGGADVVGLMSPDPFSSLAWAAEVGAEYAYGADEALRGDPIEAVVLDIRMAEAAHYAEIMLEEGAGVIFGQPDVPDREHARALLQAASTSNAPAAFALRTRAWESAAAAVRLLPELGPITQVTVLNWPVSRSARAEVCDLLRRLCGDFGVVCTVAGMMPVEELAPGVPVTLAMFAERLDHPDAVTTVVVNESPRAVFGDAQITVVGTRGRVVFGQRSVTVSDASGVRDLRLAPSPDPVTFATDALRKEFSGARHGAAGLGDALAAARLLELAALSYERHTWVDVF